MKNSYSLYGLDATGKPIDEGVYVDIRRNHIVQLVKNEVGMSIEVEDHTISFFDAKESGFFRRAKDEELKSRITWLGRLRTKPSQNLDTEVLDGDLCPVRTKTDASV